MGSVDMVAADTVISAFVAEHLGVWLDRFCDLLAGNGSRYLEAVAEAVREAAEATRTSFPTPITGATTADSAPARSA